MNTTQSGNSDLYLTPTDSGDRPIGFSPMRKVVDCANCGHEWIQDLPDVSLGEAAQLKAAFDDREVIFQCPNCQSVVRVVRWDIPDLPDPPEQVPGGAQ
jgi:rubredoxin